MNVNKNGQLCRTIWYNAQKFEVGLLAASAVQGHYLLKNGQKSIVPVYDQEYGVFIDENHYIPLKFSTRPLTYREAEVYYQSIGGEMPDLYEAVRLSLAVDSVNAALEKIGMSEFIFSAPVLSSVWYKQAVPENSREKRRCIVIAPYGDFNRPEYLVLDKGYLLYKQTALYKLEEDCYKPLALTLEFNCSQTDFFTASDGRDTLCLYRGSDLKLVPLGINVFISMVSDDIIIIDNHYCQCWNGKLLPLHGYNLYCSLTRVSDNEFFIYESGRYDEQLNGPGPDTQTVYCKNAEGRYERKSQETIEY